MSLKEKYNEVRQQLAAEGLTAEDAHFRACSKAGIKNPATQRSYRNQFDLANPPDPTLAFRSADDLTLLATRHGNPDGLKHLEADYLAGGLTFEEIQSAIGVAIEVNKRLAEQRAHLADQRRRELAAQPQGHVEAGRWVGPDDPPPIIYEHEFTDEDKTNPSEELEARSRRAAMHWNIVNSGSPVDEASAAAMAEHYPTPRVAVPFLKPTFDVPYEGEQLRQVRAQWQREIDADAETAMKSRLEQMREEDRRRAEERQMDRRMGGNVSLWPGKRR
jgi:hypothetical protein